MLRLSQTRKQPTASRLRTAAFTLVEVMAGIAMLGLVAGSIIYGLNQLNHYAMVNRLYTAAHTLAQNQIDLILTMGPYDPAGGKYPLPNNCGTASATNTILRIDQPYYYNSTLTGSCPMSPILSESMRVTLYKDPMNPTTAAEVKATVKTTITDTGMTINVPAYGTTPASVASLDLRRATVAVDYTFRNKTYSVVMETMRTSDQ